MLRFLAIVVALGASACTQIKLVPPQRQKVADTFSVAPAETWNKLEVVGAGASANRETWTRDGTSLQALHFVAVGDNQPLFRSRQPAEDKEPPLPVFRKTMNVLDVKDLIEASVVRQNFVDFATANLRPQKFGSVEGFQFDFTFSSKSGLKRKGIAAGTIANDRLYLIFYDAAALYYYERDREQVDQIVASADLTGGVPPVMAPLWVGREVPPSAEPAARGDLVPVPRRPEDYDHRSGKPLPSLAPAPPAVSRERAIESLTPEQKSNVTRRAPPGPPMP